MAHPAKSRKPTKASIKAAADRAEKRAKGEEVAPAPTVVEPEVAGKPGRPTLYSEEIAERICAELARGPSLRAVCRDETLPAESTVRSWAHNPEHPFSAQYARARELGFLSMADEVLDIADDGTNDWMVRHGKDGEDIGWVVNGEHVQRSRLRLDTRKWLLSKCLPKIYGDKVTTEVTGKDGGPIETKDTSDLEVARRVAFMLGRAVGKAPSDVPAG